MKDRVPWHVKGVQRQTRDTARAAARRSGMSVGQWLNNVVAERAAANGVYPPGPGGDWRDTGDQQIAHSINRLDQRLDQLITHGRLTGSPAPAHHPYAPPPHGHYPPPPNGHYSPAPPAAPNGSWSSGIDQAVAEMSARQRALEIDPQARGPGLPPVDYGYRPAPAPPPPAAYMPPPSPAYGPPPDLSGLEQQLRNITTQIESLNRPGELTDALSGLRSDLGEIGRMLTEAMPRRAVEALEIEVRKLAERIDFTREAGVDPSTIANMERGLADLREALGTLTPAESLVGFDDAVRGLSRKIDQMALQHDPANLQQLEAAITALRGIVSHVASNDTLMGLAEEMRGLSAKVDRVASAALGPDGLSPHAQSGESVLSAIERGFAELTSRLLDLQSHSMSHGPAPEAMDLKRDLARTQDSLEAVHGTLGHLVDRLAMIEGGFRPDAATPPPAPGYHPGPSSQAPFPPHPGANGRVGAPPAGPMAAGPGAAPRSEPPMPVSMPAPPMMESSPPQAPAPGPVSLPAIVPPPPETVETLPPTPKVRPPVARNRQPIDPNLPPDFPLEPGSGVPRARPQGSAAERIAASEAALGAVRPPNANHPGQTNFIAAARRAAQAAGPAPDAPPPQPEPAKTDKPGKSLSQRVRSLIIGGSAVLIVLASMRVALQMMEPTPEAATESKTVQAADPVTTDSIPADRIPVVRKNDGVFAATPPAGLILPGEPISKPDSVPVARTPDPDITGSIGPRGAAPVPTSEPRPILSDKLPVSLRQAALGGDPAAEYEIALRHLDGRGIPQNLEEAARWLERAAKAGVPPAQFRLGGLYEKGQGVKRNLDTARRHYVAAAEKGNAKAMHNLAVMYSEGVDGKPDYKAASLWFRKAAEHGIADSQYNLGILYARGIGIDRNLAESYKWFALAAAQGDREAAKKRDDVATRLDQGSLAAAKLAVQGFVAEPQPEEATLVKSPPGGWERPSETPRPAKKKGPGAPMKIAPS